MDKKTYSGKQKVAALLLALGEEIAATLLKHMDKTEARQLLTAMQQLGRLTQEEIDAIVSEFYDVLTRQKDNKTLCGGEKVANDLLGKALKGPTGQALMKELALGSARVKASDNVDAVTLARWLASQHPQTIALVLASCDAKKRGETLKLLDPSCHRDVLRRIAKLGPVSPEMLEELEINLRESFESQKQRGGVKKGGLQGVAKLLSHWEKGHAEALLADLAHKNPELSQGIRQQMLTFAALVELSPRDMQLLMKHVDAGLWLKALKLADDGVRQMIFRHMSPRAASLMQEDLASMPPLRKADAEQAQQAILNQVRSLVEQGVISLQSKEKWV